MLIDFEHSKYLEDGGEGKFIFKDDDGKATKEEKEWLINFDEGNFEIYGYHVIENYEDLKNN